MKATLEQEDKRRIEGGGGHRVRLRSRIEWMEAMKQLGSGQSKLRMSGGSARFPGRATGFFLGGPVHVTLGLC